MLLSDIFHPHDPILVALSATLAVLASYVSLEIAGRIDASRGRSGIAWLIAAACTMGGGIWSVHFVAMLGLTLPFPIAYDRRLTVVSFLIPVLFAAIGLYIAF